MELIYQRLFESLKKLGLEPVESAGLAFDPHVHHAVEMVESEELPDHTVIDDFQRGYNFKGRLLRPAMVRVAVEPASKKT
jgi:molecular chaperone GrpE